MKIENNRIFYHVPAHSLIEDMGSYLKLRVNFEIYIDSNFIDSHTKDDIRIITSSLGKKNILKRIHGPFLDLSPASPDIRIRRLSLERLHEGLGICSKLGCDNIVLHSHYDPVYHKRHFDLWQKHSKEVWDNIASTADRLNITVNIENSVDDTPMAVLFLLRQYPLFRACFDLAHYTIFAKGRWDAMLRQYPEGVINEIHLSDNDLTEDLHLVLGTGSVDVTGFLTALDTKGIKPAVTIEPHTMEEMIKDIQYMRNFS